MSYILDSLKKLEQEKMEVGQQTDLKSLLLKSEHSEEEISELKNKIRISMALAAVGCTIAIFFGIGYFLNKAKPGNTVSLEQPVTKAESQIKTDGIVGKSEKKNAPESQKEKPVITRGTASNYIFETEFDETPVPTRDFVIHESSVVEETQASMEGESETINERFVPIPLPEEGVRKEEIPAPYRTTFKEAQAEQEKVELPPFGISGVIFFGKGDPANYIILRDESGKRIRLQKGEKYQNVELVEIFSQKARFLFEGQTMDKEIGGL